MISQLFTQDTFKLLTLFSLSPGSRFNRNEIKERVVLNNVPLDKAISRLLASGVVRKEGSLYSLNFENSYSKMLIDVCRRQHVQLKKLPLKVYFLLADLALHVSSVRGVEVYLFGSYSKLVFTERSDVDIAFLLPKQHRDTPDACKRPLSPASSGRDSLLKLAAKAGEAYGMNVEPHFFEKSGFYANRKDPLVKEILKNGVRIV